MLWVKKGGDQKSRTTAQSNGAKGFRPTSGGTEKGGESCRFATPKTGKKS